MCYHNDINDINGSDNNIPKYVPIFRLILYIKELSISYD